jgi:hypothetical protein
MFKHLSRSLSVAFLFLSAFAFAHNVPVKNAELVARNFMQQTTNSQDITIKLFHTAKAANGEALYYVFDLNNGNGFVIVTAEDASKPIIGYSTTQRFEIPSSNSNIGNWLNKRGEEISYLRNNHIEANSAISKSWNNYINNIPAQNVNRSSANTHVAPLVTTLWNQSPYYNDLCPGGSVTGCVATTMAQIMKYWNYPKTGNGNSTYNEDDYGTLSANYANAVYVYSLMPNVCTSPNAEIAELMYHCGVSVNMDYSPAGSGAWVINADSPISAENSFINYFGYDPTEIKGVYRSDYSTANWHALLKGDLDIGRPIQYVGFGNSGGHTWVCDGYDVNNFYHMNWGWGGSGDGFFDIDVLNPSGMDFSQGQQALAGLIPLTNTAIDAGVLSVTPSEILCHAGTVNPVVKIRNYGSTTLNSCVINYKIDNQNFQTLTWNGSLVTGQTATLNLPGNNFSSGSHTITCYTSGPNNNADGDVTNDLNQTHINLISADQLPVVEGFETQSAADEWTSLPSGGSNWEVSSQSASGGTKSIMIDNLNNTAGNTSILQGLGDFDLSEMEAMPQLSFKVAYQQKTSTSNDILKLQVSDDCGKSWKTRWTKQGSALASTTVLSTTPYLPSSGEYNSYSVVIPRYYSAIFRFVFTADDTDPGNNLFLDDINMIDPAVSVQENELNVGLNLYPNPAKDKITIEYNTKESHTVNVEVFDVLGKKHSSTNIGKVDAGSHEFEIATDQLNNGIYFVTISIDGSKIVKRIVVQN